MIVSAVLDSAGRRRSPATLPGFHAGRPPRNKGMRYPADPPTVEEIIAVMRHAGDSRHGWRLCANQVGRGPLRRHVKPHAGLPGFLAARIPNISVTAQTPVARTSSGATAALSRRRR
jgi:hypothetical protein